MKKPNSWLQVTSVLEHLALSCVDYCCHPSRCSRGVPPGCPDTNNRMALVTQLLLGLAHNPMWASPCSLLQTWWLEFRSLKLEGKAKGKTASPFLKKVQPKNSHAPRIPPSSLLLQVVEAGFLGLEVLVLPHQLHPQSQGLSTQTEKQEKKKRGGGEGGKEESKRKKETTRRTKQTRFQSAGKFVPLLKPKMKKNRNICPVIDSA